MSFKTTDTNENTLIIHLPEVLDEMELKQFDLLADGWVQTEAEKVVLDFSETKDVSDKSYRSITRLLQGLKQNNKFFYTYGFAQKVKTQFAMDGMASAMNIKENLEAVLKHKHKVEPSIKAEFVTNITESVSDVLKSQVGLNVSLSKPRVKEKGEKTLYDIVSLVSINADAFQGTLALCFTKDCYLNIYNQMLDESAKEIDEENRDAAAELLNMIFGMAKSKLMNNKNVEIDKAIPSVLTGEKIKLQTNSSEVGLIIPMNSDIGVVVVEVSFSAKQE